MNTLEKIKKKLADLKQPYDPEAKKEGNSNTWKPEKGKNSIRLLPNFRLSDDQNERPFVPLNFYYDFGRTWLCPYQFEREDSAYEMYRKLYKENTDESRALAKKIGPKLRISAPILVRGKEHEGVKFWLFSPTVYRKLDALYDDPQWGNISSLEDGVDLTVDYTPDANDPKQSKTEVTPNRKSSPATTDAELLDKIKSMPEVTSIFTEPDKDELRSALERYLGVNQTEEQPVTDAPQIDTKPQSKERDELEDEFEKILRGEQ